MEKIISTYKFKSSNKIKPPISFTEKQKKTSSKQKE